MLSAETKHRLTMTETTSREDLIGMFHLIDGETRWIDGPVTVAMRNGDAVLIDEIDRYSPECASLLYSLIDDKPHVSLPTGEFVEASDGYKVIMTTNESVETLPVAVQDRIEVIIVASTPHEAAIADMPDAGRDVCMRYYKVQPVRALKLAPTVRRMRTFYRLLKNGIPNEVAANLVFGAQGAQEVLSALTSAEGN
jgi:MoxR-like ATPase